MLNYRLEGWGLLTLNDWYAYINDGGLYSTTKAVCGYIKVITEEQMGIRMSTTSEGYAYFIYADPSDKTPFFVVKGCKGHTAQMFANKPKAIGFMETRVQ